MPSHRDDPCIDENGTPLVDDPTISNEVILWRRIAPDWVHHEKLPSDEVRTRAGKVAFIDHITYRLSVYVSSEADEKQVLAERPGDSLVELKAGWFREFGYKVVRKPTLEQPSHVVICPTPERKQAKKLAEQAHIIVQKKCSKQDCLTCISLPEEGLRFISSLQNTESKSAERAD